jgi:PsbP-like protein
MRNAKPSLYYRSAVTLILLFASAALLLFAIFPEQQQQAGAQSESLLTYTNPDYGFNIQYPSDWTYTEYEVPSNATIFSILSIVPPVSADPNLQTNLDIGIEYLQNPLSLDQYVRNTVDDYRTYYENFSLISAKTNATLSGMPAYELVYTYNLNETERIAYEIGTIDKDTNTVYYISFYTEPSLFDQFFPTFQTVNDSFNLDTSLLTPDTSENILEGGGSSMQNFQLFMDSFTNSIFNGSSVFGAVGTSLVKGIEVSGINFQDNNGTNDQVTVSMSADPSIVTNNTGSVGIIATRIPFNIQNLMSLGALSSQEQSGNPFGGNIGVSPSEGGMMSPFLGNVGVNVVSNLSQSINPFDFLSNLQIGSTNLVNPDWSSPQSATMDLKGKDMGIEDSDTYKNIQATTSQHTLDLIFVSVIPFTGEPNLS